MDLVENARQINEYKCIREWSRSKRWRRRNDNSNQMPYLVLIFSFNNYYSRWDFSKEKLLVNFTLGRFFIQLMVSESEREKSELDDVEYAFAVISTK